MRALASAATLAVVLALAALGAVVPGIAHATPSKDACAMLEWDPGQPSLGVFGPHTWCLDHDIVLDHDVEGTFSLIVLEMDDITIDCRGHLLEYRGNAQASYAIRTSGFGQRATVRNCRFRGFTTAVALFASDDYLVEDNVVWSSRPGMDFEPTGAIYGSGRGTIRRNRVLDSVGLAIGADGDARITDNLVDGVIDTAADPSVVAIELTNGTSSEVRDNVIRGLRHEPAHGHVDDLHAVVVSSAFDGGRAIRLDDNVIAIAPGTPSIGFVCSPEAFDSRYGNNVLTGVAEAGLGCTDAGENDLAP